MQTVIYASTVSTVIKTRNIKRYLNNRLSKVILRSHDNKEKIDINLRIIHFQQNNFNIPNRHQYAKLPRQPIHTATNYQKHSCANNFYKSKLTLSPYQQHLFYQATAVQVHKGPDRLPGCCHPWWEISLCHFLYQTKKYWYTIHNNSWSVKLPRHHSSLKLFIQQTIIRKGAVTQLCTNSITSLQIIKYTMTLHSIKHIVCFLLRMHWLTDCASG